MSASIIREVNVYYTGSSQIQKNISGAKSSITPFQKILKAEDAGAGKDGSRGKSRRHGVEDVGFGRYFPAGGRKIRYFLYLFDGGSKGGVGF